MGILKCSWVRDRLPLLAGDELVGLDRRRVERHLLGCLGCRQHQHSLNAALGVLHTARAEAPALANGSSLWPALERQIRESRRPSPTWSSYWPQLVFRPALGLGLSFGVLAVLAGVITARVKVDDATDQITVAAQPIAPLIVQAIPKVPVEVSEPVREPSEAPVVENSPPARLDYVLDHAVPMPQGTDARDSKQPTY